MTTAAIYTRISDDERGVSLSPERQEQECRAFADRQGWEVARVYSDRDISGYKDVARPGYEALVADAHNHNVVIVWKLDRLTRKGIRGLSDALTHLGDCRIVSVNEAIDTTNAMGEAMAGVIASMGKAESENISLRVTSANAHEAKSGKPRVLGHRTFGYADTSLMALDESEADRVRKMARRLIDDGESYGVLAKELNADGITTANGGKWSSSSLARYMRQPVIAALRDYKGNTYRGIWPAIITEDEHYELKGLVAKVDRTGHSEHKYVPVLYCHCGAKMAVQVSGSRKRYRCAAVNTAGMEFHGWNSIAYDALNKYLDEVSTFRILDYIAEQGRQQAQPEDIAAAIKAAEAQLLTATNGLSKLNDRYYIDNDVEEAEFDRLRAILKDREGEAKATIARLAKSQVIRPVEIDKAQMLKAIMGRVIIKDATHKTGKYDIASRVIITGKDALS